MKDPNSDKLDKLIAAVNADKPSNSEIEAAAQRVREKLAKESLSTVIQQQETTIADPIINEQKMVIKKKATIEDENLNEPRLDSLEQYLHAIPDYLANRLSPALTELFETEARQSMELRRALNKAKSAVNQSEKKEQEGARKPRRFAWFYSAAAAIVLSVSFILVSPKFPSFDQSQLVQVEDVSGKLYQLKDGHL